MSAADDFKERLRQLLSEMSLRIEWDWDGQCYDLETSDGEYICMESVMNRIEEEQPPRRYGEYYQEPQYEIVFEGSEFLIVEEDDSPEWGEGDEDGRADGSASTKKH